MTSVQAMKPRRSWTEAIINFKFKNLFAEREWKSAFHRKEIMGPMRQIRLRVTALVGGGSEGRESYNVVRTMFRPHPQYVHPDNPEIITRKSC